MTAVMIDRYIHKPILTIEAMALAMPDVVGAHPNRVDFSGILTQVDEPSTRPPNGSSGHRVLIPKAVAEAALPTLLGMPVDCSFNLQDHDKQVVVGIITGADIQGKNVIVSGHLFKKNWPAEVEVIQSQKAQLGMSYEVSAVEVEDVDAEIWTLTSLQFTGAAILLKSAAAYQHTAIAARAEEDDMAGAVDKVLERLDGIQLTLRNLEAARMDEDDEEAAKQEEAAKCHEEEAARYDAQALQARSDSDEEDAKKHEEEASKARMAASVARLAAAKRHEEAAARLKAAAESADEAAAKEEAATEAARHEAEATRLKEEDARSKKDEEDAKADAKADAQAKQEAAATNPMEQMASFFKMYQMFAGMGNEQAAAKSKKDDDPDDTEKMWGMFLRGMMRAMSYPPGMMDSKHDDKEEDIALMKQFLRQGKDKGMAASTPVNLEERRRMRRIEASMELLTDQVSKLTGLMTDVVSRQRNLATDGNQGANGGAAPQRKTMHATTEQWVDKYGEYRTDGKDTKRTDGKMTWAEIDAQLDAERVPMDQRIARKAELQRAGRVAN